MEKVLGVLLERVWLLDRVDKPLQILEGSDYPSPDRGKEKVQHGQTEPPTMDTSGVFCVGRTIEVGIESRDYRTSGVGFEGLQADLFYVHYWDEIETLRGRTEEEGGFGDGNPMAREREFGILEGF